MSFRPRPQFLNLGVGRPRLGARGGQTNELFFSQLTIPTRPPPTTTIHPSSFTRKSRLSTTSSPPLFHHHHHHHHHRPRSQPHNHGSAYRQKQQTRHNSINPNPNNPNPSHHHKANANANDARIDRLLTRLPRFLHPYLSSLRSSPSSFVVAFLILHEITAVVPGLGFFYLFHYCGNGGEEEEEEEEDKEGSSSYGKKFERWVMGWMMEHGYSEVMTSKMEGFERWFKRKGYFGFGKGEEEGEGVVGKDGEKGKGAEGEEEEEGGREQKEQVLMKKWQSGDEKYRVLVDAALAYAITKALLPVRIIVSVQATPWFAGVLERVRRVFGGGLKK